MSPSCHTARASASSHDQRLKRIALVCGLVLQVGCGRAFIGPVDVRARACEPADACVGPRPESRVQVIDPLLEERIRYLTERSESFRDAWDMIQGSGVPVTIGTAEQLQSQLPSAFRKDHSGWAGVTVARPSASGRKLGRAFVALQVRLIERMAEDLHANGRAYVLGEIDRVLIHEIYGHLAPMVAVQGAGQECPDEARPGEATPCVKLREEHVTRELGARVAVGGLLP